MQPSFGCSVLRAIRGSFTGVPLRASFKEIRKGFMGVYSEPEKVGTSI